MNRACELEAGLLLFQTLGCHLCEHALRVIDAAANGGPHSLELVDIADDDRLVQQYGTRIPVLRRRDTGAELDWPFTPEDVAGFLQPAPPV